MERIKKAFRRKDKEKELLVDTIAQKEKTLLQKEERIKKVEDWNKDWNRAYFKLRKENQDLKLKTSPEVEKQLREKDKEIEERDKEVEQLKEKVQEISVLKENFEKTQLQIFHTTLSNLDIIFGIEGTHNQKMDYGIGLLRNAGYEKWQIETEYDFEYGSEGRRKSFRIDVIAKRKGKVEVAMECGTCSFFKLKKLCKLLPKVIWLPYVESERENSKHIKANNRIKMT